MTQRSRATATRAAALSLLILAPAIPARGQSAGPGASAVPSLTALVGQTGSELATVVRRFDEDARALGRRYDTPWSPERRARFTELYRRWRDHLAAVDFDALGVEGRIDWVLLDGEVEYRLSELEREARLFDEVKPMIPFATEIIRLQEARRRLEPVEPEAVAETLTELADAAEAARSDVALSLDGPSSPTPIVGLRAADALTSMRRTLDGWYGYHAGYDPVFTWWVRKPYEAVAASLAGYETFLREEVVGYREREDPPIIGDPIGAEGLAADLRHEMIPYSPEELLEIGRREYAWCEARMKEASRELGFGDDWLAAVEHVKGLHVEPGAQPALIEDLYEQSVVFIEERDLVTIPPLAEEVWRMEMMSPERQKVSPFFLGGEVILVSYPTDAMAHEDKLMSMRGNNEHFSRATVQHELIPGHHLQGFMTDRYNVHRQLFGTPFWHEGNALYWEFRLWDLGFPRGPEDRVGMLFWRMHRAARIIFSLSFHLGEMTPDEAVDFLVERVGHERANAEAEVRRSFNGSYPPLYQAGYMLGGLQFMALHDELVGSGRMTERAFHDAILKGGPMPVAMVRARLTEDLLPRDYTPGWRFYDGL